MSDKAEKINLSESVGEEGGELIKPIEFQAVSSLGDVEEKISTFKTRNEELRNLIYYSENISDSDREKFKKELEEIDEAGRNLTQKVLHRLSKVMDTVLESVSQCVEAYSKRFGEKRKRIKGMEFIFNNLDIENKEKYIKEWENKRDSDDFLYGVYIPEFPLNNEGVEILQYCNKQTIHSLYDIEGLIRFANSIYELIKKGLSIKILSHVNISDNNDCARILSGDNVDKLKILQNTDIISSKIIIDIFVLRDLSIKQMNILIKNSYIKFLWKDSFTLYKLPKYLTEENLQKIKDFDDELLEITINNFLSFCEVLSDKSKEVVDIYKAQYHKDGDKKLWRISQNRNRMELESLDKKKLSLVKRLIQESSFSIYQDSVEPWTRLDENIFDRCEILGIKDINAEFYWHMYNLSFMLEDEFDMLTELRKYYDSPLGNQIEAVKYLNNIFEKDEIKDLMVILNKVETYKGVNSLNHYFKDKDMLWNMKNFLKEIDQVKNINVVDFILKVYGKDGLANICLYEVNDPRLTNLIHDIKTDPSSLSGRISDDVDCRENIFLNFSEIQEKLQSIGTDFSDKDMDSILQNVLNYSSHILLSDYDNFPFPLNDKMKKNIAEKLVSDHSTLAIGKFKNFDNRYLTHLDVEKRQEIINILFENLLYKNPIFIMDNLKIFEQEYLSHMENRQEIVGILFEKVLPIKLLTVLEKIKFFNDEYLSHIENGQGILNNLFEECMSKKPLIIIESVDFPFTPEQQKYIDVFKRVLESPSREMKNMSAEIIPLISSYRNFEEANIAVAKIEQMFLTNNIPMIGKQYKVFEILYPDNRLSYVIKHESKIESLKTLKDSSKQRLAIFKDLMRAHIASCDINLEQYLLVLQSSKDVLDRFEQGENLNKQEKDQLKLFLKKINVLSGHTGRQDIVIGDSVLDEVIHKELNGLKNAFGVGEGGSIVQRFERTFLKRIGIESIDEAISLMRKYKKEANDRNEEAARGDVLIVKEGDLVKGVSSDYFDTYLDKGVYAPEFVGAASAEAKRKSQNSDMTPFDTDLTMVEKDGGLNEAFAEYGDMSIIIKKKPQFEKDKLDIFKTGVIGQNHYGIRTGFGSTQIDAICIRQKGISSIGMDKIKFFVAQKGFYIPIYDSEKKILFTKDQYDEYRKIFDGIDRFEGGDIDISDEWRNSKLSQEIEGIAQTEEKIQSIEEVRNIIQDKIRDILKQEGISMHKGEYDDSLVGAIISDTGSTGRGSALDEKFDFDFAVKLDDNDWDKVSLVMDKLKGVFEMETSYENKGMIMFRSKDVEIKGHQMTIDVGFNKKSDSEDFDAHIALSEKYKSIEKKYGRQGLLNTLTNIRFAKKKLKEADCYKKGVGTNGQQGGLGGIGVEYWIIQNGGDAIRAFSKFAKSAIVDGQMISFDEFKKVYKIFSAGVNIRGNQKVENFMENMTEVGYEKMVKLAVDLTL